MILKSYIGYILHTNLNIWFYASMTNISYEIYVK